MNSCKLYVSMFTDNLSRVHCFKVKSRDDVQYIVCHKISILIHDVLGMNAFSGDITDLMCTVYWDRPEIIKARD